MGNTGKFELNPKATKFKRLRDKCRTLENKINKLLLDFEETNKDDIYLVGINVRPVLDYKDGKIIQLSVDFFKDNKPNS